MLSCWNVTQREMVLMLIAMWVICRLWEDFWDSYLCAAYHALWCLCFLKSCKTSTVMEFWQCAISCETNELSQQLHVEMFRLYFLWRSGSQKADGLSPAQTCRTHFMAALRVTWLSRITILQMCPTCLMPLNHDKVDFMRKPESTQPTSRGLQGQN